MNFGVPAYNTLQESALLRKSVIDYSPDLIIIGFYYNDLDISHKRQPKLTGKRDIPFQIDSILLKHSVFYQYAKFSLRNNAKIAGFYHSQATTGHYLRLLENDTPQY